MELTDKVNHIIRCIKLGMDLESSMYAAACTEGEMDTLMKDPEFISTIKVKQAIEEMNLLELHEDAMHAGVSKGNATAIQWKLERMTERWSPKSTVKTDAPINFPTQITLTGKAPEQGGQDA